MHRPESALDDLGGVGGVGDIDKVDEWLFVCVRGGEGDVVWGVGVLCGELEGEGEGEEGVDVGEGERAGGDGEGTGLRGLVKVGEEGGGGTGGRKSFWTSITRRAGTKGEGRGMLVVGGCGGVG